MNYAGYALLVIKQDWVLCSDHMTAFWCLSVYIHAACVCTCKVRFSLKCMGKSAFLAAYIHCSMHNS